MLFESVILKEMISHKSFKGNCGFVEIILINQILVQGLNDASIAIFIKSLHALVLNGILAVASFSNSLCYSVDNCFQIQMSG